jgi:cyclic pyranopterin phosphate synthase
MAANLIDSYGRKIGDLRISVTDRCNFRCSYCIPVENIQWKRRDEILTYEEIAQLVRLFVRLGVSKVRVTGGEPLLRPGVLSLIEQLTAIEDIGDLALTTNGKLLPEFAQSLRGAGVRRLNISLDSLQPQKFEKMTRRDALADVLRGIEAATEAGFAPLKINAVVMRGINDDEIIDFADFARTTGHTVRFIEFMPLDSGHMWKPELVVTGREVYDAISAKYELVPLPARSPSETALRYRFADNPAEIGIIAPVSNPFCGNCNRLRLTADGQLRTCLFSVIEHDLKTPMRAGATEAELEHLIREAVWGKEQGHKINRPEFQQPLRTMSCIGG